jgi:hypothetical protein
MVTSKKTSATDPQDDSFPAVEDGGAQWDHPHLTQRPKRPFDAGSVAAAASRRRAIALLDKE